MSLSVWRNIASASSCAMFRSKATHSVPSRRLSTGTLIPPTTGSDDILLALAIKSVSKKVKAPPVVAALFLLALLLHATTISVVGAFGSDPPPPRRRCASQRHSHVDVGTTGTTCAGSIDAAYYCRMLAAEALVPVLYPDSDGRTVEADKALKRCLRTYERVWRRGNGNGNITTHDHGATSTGRSTSSTGSESDSSFCCLAQLPSSTREEREANRKMISSLILGTAVMRLRHWYRLCCASRTAIEPIVGVEPWMIGWCKYSDGGILQVEEPLDTPSYLDSHLAIALKLVGLHAAYMNGKDESSDQDIIVWPTDVIHRISLQQSLPSFIVGLWVEQYGPKSAEIIAQLSNKPGPVTLRRNAICCDSDDNLIRRLKDEGGVDAFVPRANVEHALLAPPRGCIRLQYDGRSGDSARPQKSVWSLQAWQDGCFEVQDIGSQLIADSVEVRSNDVVIDYCAGNGGKTLALASRMWESKASFDNSAGVIFAHDIVESRLKQIRGSLKRCGIERDASANNSKKQCHIPRVVTTSNATSFRCGMADAVLVDAPWSSLGVLRRRPGHRWALTEPMIRKSFPELQLAILKNASRLVKPGGRLVYATCSICWDENEGVVKRFEALQGFEENWEPWDYTDSHCRSILPHVHDSDGFFVSRWKRKWGKSVAALPKKLVDD